MCLFKLSYYEIMQLTPPLCIKHPSFWAQGSALALTFLYTTDQYESATLRGICPPMIPNYLNIGFLELNLVEGHLEAHRDKSHLV